jgi:hypothetical protein
VSDGDCVELECNVKRKVNRASSGLLPLRTGQKLAECTALGGLCEKCKDKVNKTDMNYPVVFVSGGGRMEGRKTPRVHRIGRPLGGVQRKGHRDHQVLSSVNRVGRRLDGEWKAQQGGEE